MYGFLYLKVTTMYFGSLQELHLHTKYFYTTIVLVERKFIKDYTHKGRLKSKIELSVYYT